MNAVKLFASKIFQRILNTYWFGVYSGYKTKYKISKKFGLNGVGIKFYGDGMIIAGPDSYIGEYSTIQVSPDHTVKIGQFCRISHNVRIYTTTAIPDHDFSVTPIPKKNGNVTIENACWIGANVFINPGVVIGENSVVGANSVVTKDIPSFEIWGGVPAKFIRKKQIA